jgi:hypothetical protein
MTTEEKVDLILTQLCEEYGATGECDMHGSEAVLVAFNNDTAGDICCRDCLGEALFTWFKHIEQLEK